MTGEFLEALKQGRTAMLHQRPGSARTMSERIGMPDVEMTMLAENCA